MDYVYTYSELENDINLFKKEFHSVPVFSIGRSIQGRRLYALRLGKGGGKRVFFNGAHHGMEWLTSKLLMDFAFDLERQMYETAEIMKNCTLYIVPMVNPDGVEIASSGRRWQANARGVDLNHNYDALWHRYKEMEEDIGIKGPGPTRFSGAYPESEPESRAIADFTRQNDFDVVMAFHSQGQVIYYDFCGYVPPLTLDYVNRFERVSPYKAENPDKAASYGGYKDWFIKTYKRPGFTIETGKGENPLPVDDLPEIYEKTLPLMIEALKFNCP